MFLYVVEWERETGIVSDLVVVSSNAAASVGLACDLSYTAPTGSKGRLAVIGEAGGHLTLHASRTTFECQQQADERRL